MTTRRRVQDGDAAGGVVDGLAQVGPHDVLEEVSGGAGGDRRAHLFPAGEGGEDEDPAGGRFRAQAADGGSVSGSGEGDVQQDDVRAEGAGEGHGDVCARGLADQAQVRLFGQEGAQPLPDGGVGVCDEDAQGGRAGVVHEGPA